MWGVVNFWSRRLFFWCVFWVFIKLIGIECFRYGLGGCSVIIVFGGDVCGGDIVVYFVLFFKKVFEVFVYLFYVVVIIVSICEVYLDFSRLKYEKRVF